MWENIIWAVFFGVPFAIGGIAMALPVPEFNTTRMCFIFDALVVLARITWWIAGEHHFENKLLIVFTSLSFLIVSVILGFGLRWVNNRELKTNREKNFPFSVKIITWSGRIINDPHGIGFWVMDTDPQGKLVVHHADLGVFIQVVNLQSSLSQLASYIVEVKIKGKWVMTKKLDSRMGEICFVPPGGDFHRAFRVKPDTFFDHAISERNIQPNETVRGWILLKYPKGTELVANSDVPEFKICLKDTAGITFESEPLRAKEKVTNDDAQLPTVLNKGGTPINLSVYRQE